MADNVFEFRPKGDEFDMGMGYGIHAVYEQLMPRLKNCLENLHDHPARHVLRGVVKEMEAYNG